MEFGLIRGVRGQTLDEDRVALFSNLSPGSLQFLTSALNKMMSFYYVKRATVVEIMLLKYMVKASLTLD